LQIAKMLTWKTKRCRLLSDDFWFLTLIFIQTAPNEIQIIRTVGNLINSIIQNYVNNFCHQISYGRNYSHNYVGSMAEFIA